MVFTALSTLHNWSAVEIELERNDSTQANSVSIIHSDQWLILDSRSQITWI